MRAGDSLDICVSTNPPSKFQIEILRTGYDGGRGMRLMTTLGPLDDSTQPDPAIGPKNLHTFRWQPATTLTIPADWPSGVYLGRLTCIPGVEPVNGGGDWIVTKPDHWIFAGTGVKAGEHIPGLVGWEYHGDPPQDIPGLEIVGSGTALVGGKRPQQWMATIYPGPKGNFVFNVSTIFWSQGLSSPPGHTLPWSHWTRPHGPDERVQESHTICSSAPFSRPQHASMTGKIDTLFIDVRREQWGSVDSSLGKAVTCDRSAVGSVDLVNLAASETLLRSGNVFAAEGHEFPSSGLMAAIYRY